MGSASQSKPFSYVYLLSDEQTAAIHQLAAGLGKALRLPKDKRVEKALRLVSDAERQVGVKPLTHWRLIIEHGWILEAVNGLNACYPPKPPVDDTSRSCGTGGAHRARLSD